MCPAPWDLHELLQESLLEDELLHDSSQLPCNWSRREAVVGLAHSVCIAYLWASRAVETEVSVPRAAYVCVL